MDIGFLYPDAPDTAPEALLRDVLDSFPGISFVTIPDGELVVETSKNYYEKARGHQMQPQR